MKKILLFTILITTLILTGCLQKKTETTGEGGQPTSKTTETFPTTETPQTPGEPTSPLEDLTANWQTYRNEEYGFSVEFPDSWEGYQVNKWALRWGSDDYDVFSFGFTGEIDTTLFSVSAFTQEKWQKDVSQDTITSGGRLCENDNYVFAREKAQDSRPEDIDRYREVDGILASFSCF